MLKTLYGNNTGVLSYQEKRYKKLADEFYKKFNSEPEYYFSTPGRTEISGNHTDHNHGKVIAAAINLDSIASVIKCNNVVEVYSDAYKDPFVVEVNDTGIKVNEAGTTNALIRGIINGFEQNGFRTGGFKACITSDVLQGSGLSSSASIEILIGTILNYLYNDAAISPEIIAQIGQYAENVYFKKPCGLMDQMACAIGGIISIDFENPVKPLITRPVFDFKEQDYSLIIVHTGGSHISLTNDYAAIPAEMKQVALEFDKDVCRDVDYPEFAKKINQLRGKVSDRALLRAFHFFKENDRVDSQISALEKNDFKTFLKLVNESGDSSFKYLQNIYSTDSTNYQPVAVSLAFTGEFINKIGEGACRIHGGGFEGTIQVMIPEKYINEFSEFINNICSDYKVYNLNIRQIGTTQIIID